MWTGVVPANEYKALPLTEKTLKNQEFHFCFINLKDKNGIKRPKCWMGKENDDESTYMNIDCSVHCSTALISQLIGASQDEKFD